MNWTPLDNLHRRLKKMDIDIKLSLNYPWIYLDKINGKKVTEKFASDFGFLMASITLQEEIKFVDLRETFKIIRKYR